MIIEVLNNNTEPLSITEYARMFKALGDPTRLEIFRCLCSCRGPAALDDLGGVRPVDGPTVGEVCCQINGSAKSSPLISHHLKELRIAGLITMERRGKNMICAVSDDARLGLSRLFDECCCKLTPAECYQTGSV